MTRALAYIGLATLCIALGFAGGAIAAFAERGSKDQARAVTTIEKAAPRVIRAAECRSA